LNDAYQNGLNWPLERFVALDVTSGFDQRESRVFPALITRRERFALDDRHVVRLLSVGGIVNDAVDARLGNLLAGTTLAHFGNPLFLGPAASVGSFK
jgi:hypothetical protein